MKLKRNKIYTTINCCREVRLDLLCAKLKIGQMVKGWRTDDVIEIWKVIEIDEKDRNNCKVKFIGYAYEW
jgi:hypothetical protein